MRLIMGSDHRGRDLCLSLRKDLNGANGAGIEYAELDIEGVDYPDVASRVALAIGSGLADFGILICGTGIGMTIVANKYPGIRAAPCHSVLAAELSRRFYDANILCLSGDMLGERSGLQIVEKWLTTPFDGGKHAKRLDKIEVIGSKAVRDAL